MRRLGGWPLIVAILAGLTAASFPLIRDQAEAVAQRHSGPWVYGPLDARWTITKFADLECPYCKTYTPVLKAWVKQQRDVNLQWHHLPLQFHEPAASRQARLVECAGVLGGPEAFWKTVDQVFQRTHSNGQGFHGHLDVTGVDTRDLEDCSSNDQEVAMRIVQQIKEAAARGISATPTLVITDNTTGRSIKLEGPADAVTLLSAIDWLAAQSGRNP